MELARGLELEVFARRRAQRPRAADVGAAAGAVVDGGAERQRRAEAAAEHGPRADRVDGRRVDFARDLRVVADHLVAADQDEAVAAREADRARDGGAADRAGRIGRVRGGCGELGLGAVGDLPATDHALQTFGSAGVDYVLSSSPRRILRGEVLDEGMLWPVSFGQAVVASYRHYELASDDPFGMRLALVDRSAVDEVSMLVRRVFDARGIVGGELRGGVGYDQAREVRLWRAGGSLTLAATATTRLSVLYDITNERGAGITGRRHAGGVSLHVDL